MCVCGRCVVRGWSVVRAAHPGPAAEPVAVLGQRGVDAGAVGLAAAFAPGHDAHLQVMHACSAHARSMPQH